MTRESETLRYTSIPEAICVDELTNSPFLG
jgi:hypothetical protein